MYINQMVQVGFTKTRSVITEEGMIELLVRSQQALAKELAEYMGIKIIGHKYVRKEAGTIHTIQKVLREYQ